MLSLTMVAATVGRIADNPGWGWGQMLRIGAALVLSTLIGLEREAGQKSAGLRTHALVGLGSALFMEVSRFGFGESASDPSRLAAQVVSGIGFIGGGIIFVRRDSVRGLTTAATVWLTCAVGMACAGGLLPLAAVCTGAYFLVIRGYPFLLRHLAPALAAGTVDLHLVYRTGRGLLPRVLEACAAAGFRVLDTRIERRSGPRREPGGGGREPAGVTHVCLVLDGRADPQRFAAQLSELDEGMVRVSVATDADDRPPLPAQR